MKIGGHPELFLFERFILVPCSVGFAGLALWASLSRHWLSAAFLLVACAGMVLMALDLRRKEKRPERLTQGQSGEEIPEDGEAEPDEWQNLTNVIVRTNILLCALLVGLICSEHYRMIRSAVFVVLFSILFPAAAALFCLAGERVLGGNGRGEEQEPASRNLAPPWHGAARPH